MYVLAAAAVSVVVVVFVAVVVVVGYGFEIFPVLFLVCRDTERRSLHHSGSTVNASARNGQRHVRPVVIC